jgi:hypothetical protein
MSALTDMGDAISDALERHPVADVLGVLTGSMVGLILELTRRSGNDPDKTITIDGGSGQRKITIHALGESQNHGEKP